MNGLRPNGMQARPNQRTVGVYGNMDFPDVGYQEYPKMVTLASGRRVAVKSMAEERDILLDQPVVESPKSAIVAERDSMALRVKQLQDQVFELNQRSASSALAEQNRALMAKIDEVTLELLAVKAERDDLKKVQGVKTDVAKEPLHTAARPMQASAKV